MEKDVSSHRAGWIRSVCGQHTPRQQFNKQLCCVTAVGVGFYHQSSMDFTNVQKHGVEFHPWLTLNTVSPKSGSLDSLEQSGRKRFFVCEKFPKNYLI